MRTFSDATVTAAALATALLLGAPASAQPPSPPPPPSPTAAPASGIDPSLDADELFRQGKAYSKDGKTELAYDAYRAAFAKKQSYDIAGNLGKVELDLGKAREAAEHLSYCLRNFPATGTPEQRDKVGDLLQQARNAVGALSITVNVEGAEVVVDGLQAGKAPIGVEVFVDPGKHTVRAKLEGYEDAQVEIECAKGATKAVPIEMKKAGQSGDGSAGYPSNADKPKTGIIVGGLVLTAAAAGAGAAFLVMSGSKGDDRRAKLASLGSGSSVCAGASPPSACADIRDLSGSERTFRGLAIGGFVVAGAAAAGTLAYWLWPRHKKQTQAGITLAPVAGPTIGGVDVAGAF